MRAIETVSKSGYAPSMRKPNPPPSGKIPPRRRRRAAAPGAPSLHPNRIFDICREKDVSYAQLAEAAGTHFTTVARLATGKQKLTHEWMKKLAVPLGVAPQDFLIKPSEPQLVRVRVKGSLRAGDWAETHEWPDDEQYDVMVPDDAQLRGVALYGGEIEGESMNQRYPNGSAVVLSRLLQRPGEIATGKRYHVRVTRPDGQTEETIKTLVRDDDGKFWLRPESTRPEHQEWIPLDGRPGATVELVGRVRFVVQREE